MAKNSGKRTRHIPQRTCIGCRQVLAKRSLIRIIRTPVGVQVDLKGKSPGRGAYLHNQRSCWEKGLKGALSGALRIELSEQDRSTLVAFMQSLPNEPEETKNLAADSNDMEQKMND